MRVINEQIEVLKKVSGENSTKPMVRQLCFSKVLNDRQYAFDGVRAGIHPLQLRQRHTRVDSHPRHAGRSVCLEVEFVGKSRIDGCGLGAGIHEKIVRAGVVDSDGHNYQGALHEPKG
jgi:hypothetical protein